MRFGFGKEIVEVFELFEQATVFPHLPPSCSAPLSAALLPVFFFGVALRLGPSPSPSSSSSSLIGTYSDADDYYDIVAACCRFCCFHSPTSSLCSALLFSSPLSSLVSFIITIFHLLLLLLVLVLSLPPLLPHFICRNSNFSFDDEVCVDFVFQAQQQQQLEHAACPWGSSNSRVDCDCDWNWDWDWDWGVAIFNRLNWAQADNLRCLCRHQADKEETHNINWQRVQHFWEWTVCRISGKFIWNVEQCVTLKKASVERKICRLKYCSLIVKLDKFFKEILG